MKPFLFTICLFYSALNIYAQKTPKWTVYKKGITEKYYKDLSCLNDSLVYFDSINKISHTCKFPYHVESISPYIRGRKVNTILELKNKNLIIGTDEGISIYNGTEFINNSFTDNEHGEDIYSIFQAKNGNIYAGGYNNIYIFDGVYWKRKDFTNTGRITSIIQRKNGNIYVSSENNIFILNQDKWTPYNLEKTPISTSKITCLLENNNNLYVGTNEGLHIFDGINWTSKFVNNEYHTLIEDIEGTVHATHSKGTNRFKKNIWYSVDQPRNMISNYNSSFTISSSSSSYYYGNSSQIMQMNYSGTVQTSTSIFTTENSYSINYLYNTEEYMYVCTHNGFFRYKKSPWGLEEEKYYSQASSMNGYDHMLESSNKNLYFGTSSSIFSNLLVYKALEKKWYSIDDFELIKLTEGNNNEIFFLSTSNKIYKLIEDKPTQIDCPTNKINDILYKDNKLYVTTPSELLIFNDTNWTSIASEKNILEKIYTRKSGEILITTSNGIISKNGTNLKKYSFSTTGNYSIIEIVESSKNQLYCLIKDHINDNYNIVEFDNNNFNGTWTIQTYMSEYLDKNYTCKGMVIDKNDNIYVSFESPEIFMWNIYNNKTAIYSHENSILSKKYINYLYSNNQGDVFIIQNFQISKLHQQSQINTISGTIFFDENQNQKKDINEVFIPTHKIKLTSSTGEELISFSNNQGKFSFEADTGIYTIECLLRKDWINTTNNSSITFSMKSPIDTFSFGLMTNKPQTKLHTSSNLSRTRCNFTIPLFIDFQNDGETTEDITLTLDLDKNIELVESSLEPNSSSNNKYSWIKNGFKPFNHSQIQLQLQMPNVDFIGDTLKSYTSISTTNGYIYTDTLKSVLTCAYDPNDKLSKPLGLSKEHYTLIGKDLEYTIRFQNTGSDTAFTVMILDTIDTNLDINSFNLIGYSHPVTISQDQNIFKFEFNNILLPDSNVNEAKSHGFVSFKLTPKTGLKENTKVENTGYIYFDFNPPIITNTAFNTYTFNTYKITSNIKTIDLENEITITPNPFSNKTNIQFKNDKKTNFTLQVTDITGKVVEKINNINTNQFIFNRDNLSNGVYFYQLFNNDKVYTGKMLIQQ